MSISAFFSRLGAPLHNLMWSWGAQRKSDGAIFLRAWQDETLKINGIYHVCILNKSLPESVLSSNGIKERLQHIDSIRAGSQAYIVMIRAVNTNAIPREIAGFNEQDIFIGGQLLEQDDKIWLSYTKRIPAKDIMPK